jgi:hypothetical protein
MTDSKLIPFATPSEHKQVWYTWGPVLGRYDALGVELLRDTKTGNWFIVSARGTCCSTVPAYVSELAEGMVEMPQSSLPIPDDMTREQFFRSKIYPFMDWLMGMLKRHA